MLTLHKACLLLSTLGVLSSCRPLAVATNLPPAQFAGLTSLKGVDKSVELAWSAPTSITGQYDFRIYQSSPDELPGNGALVTDLSGRKVYLFSNFSSASPKQAGTQIGEVASSTFTYHVPQDLDEQKNYAFQVVATNKLSGISDSNATVIAVQGFGAVDYKGCLSADGVDYKSIKVTFDIPDQVSSVNVLRNGVSVYTSADTSVKSYTDTGLSPGVTYEYTCTVQLGTKALIGPQPFNATTLDPFKTYKGCITATALGADTAEISVYEPVGADKINIYRNGNLATTLQIAAADVAKGDITAKVKDPGLLEGQTYTYSCAAVKGTYEHFGTDRVLVTTLSTNPPTFAGITGVTVVSSSSVTVTWGANSGVPATEFKVYATPGGAVDYTTPAMIVAVGALSATLTGLGDELPYSFAVRACTMSNVCDSNTIALNVPTVGNTMPDAGAPSTTGIASVTKSAGTIKISAPWTPRNGLILFRRVAFYCDNNAASSSGNLADYVATQDFYVSNPLQVPTALTVANMLPYQNQICHFILQDYDRSSRSNGNLAAKSLNIGNLSPPVGFAGINSFTNPTTGDTQTTLNVGFTPIPVQSVSAPHGASQYLIYLLAGTSGDPCLTGTVQATLPAATYPPPTGVVYTLTGLTPNTSYRSCVKAVDSDGNLDANANQLSAKTLVATPPIFTGLQIATYNVAGVKVDLQWNAATPTILPIGSYYLRFRMNSFDLGGAGYTQVAIPTTSCAGTTCTYSIVPANYPSSGVANGGTLYAGVYACDNYDIVNTSQPPNCTSITMVTTKQVTVPNLTPPANFLGIYGVSNAPGGSRQNGVVEVSWALNGCVPAACSWPSTYAGFKIYDLNGSFQPISVSCGANAQGIPDCSIGPVYSKLISGLAPNRSYKFFVTAFNSNFVETNTSQSVSIIAPGTDTIAPNFPASASLSGISMTFNQGARTINLAWNTATDNQVAGALTYNVFQQVLSGTSCSTVTAASINTPATATLGTSGSSITASQVINQSAGGQVYAYRVTAVDVQGNTKVANDFTCLYIPDLVPPVFSTKPSASIAYQSGSSKNWGFSWVASDNNTASGNLTSRVYVATSSSKTPPTPSALLFTSGIDANYLSPDQLMTSGSRVGQFTTNGVTRYPDGANFVTRDSNDITTDRYYHYIVVITDADGNYNYDTVSLFSTGFRVINFTRTQGTTAGGKVLVVEGSGFTATTAIYMGPPSDNKVCTPLVNSDGYFELSGRITDTDPARVRQFIACTTPAHTAGSVNIYAVDSGLQAVSASIYGYYTPTGSAAENPCDQTYGTQTTGPLQGSNTAASPQIICNRSQLALINNNNCNHTDNFSSIADNIYFGTTAWPALGGTTLDISGVTPTLMEGNGNFMIGLRPTNRTAGAVNVALFDNANTSCLASLKSTIQNLSLVRARFLQTNLSGIASNFTANLGTIYGNVDNANNNSPQVLVKNVHVEVSDTDRSITINDLGAINGQGLVDMESTTVNAAFSSPVTGYNIGGATGYSEAPYFGYHIKDSVFKVSLTGRTGGQAGGIIGGTQASILNVSNSAVYGDISTNQSFGGITGTTYNSSSLALVNVGIYGTLATTGDDIGGILGQQNGGVINAENVTIGAAISTTGANAGGIVGEAILNGAGGTVNITNSTLTGSVTAARVVGGMIAYLEFSSPTSSASLAGVKTTAASSVNATTGGYFTGGLIGQVAISSVPALTIAGASVKGAVHGGSQTGGLIGYAQRDNNTTVSGTYGQITQAVISGPITGTIDTGGFFGLLENKENTNTADIVSFLVSNSYVTSAITATQAVGGFAGRFYGSGNKGPFYYAKFQNSFARASFPNMGSAISAGRLFGTVSNALPDGQASSVYYDAGYVPGTVLANPIGTGTLSGLTNAALTSAQFNATGNFAGWDFTNTWQISNGTYPSLIANPE